jgi:hypothetical protein
MDEPDTLTIDTFESDELAADQADLWVTIEGRSLFTGQQAFKKAREVSDLIEALAGLVPEDEVFLQDVRANVATGLTGKNSTAIYKLRIGCKKLEDLADIIGVIASRKNADLTGITWRYGAIAGFRDALLEKCLLESKRKAEKVASLLGVRLLGVRDLIEQFTDPENAVQQFGQAGPGDSLIMRASAAGREMPGLSAAHSKRLSLKLTVKYRVGPFGAGAAGLRE